MTTEQLNEKFAELLEVGRANDKDCYECEDCGGLFFFDIKTDVHPNSLGPDTIDCPTCGYTHYQREYRAV